MNRCFCFLISLLLLLPMMTIHAQTQNVTSYTLPNGLKLFVQEDHRAPLVVSQVWYKVGSSYEPNGITGISHALEHMMFKGTPKHGPGEFSRIIAENGGQENAMTDTDFTMYYQTLEANKLPISFELEADRMRNLSLSPAEFGKEIQVVMEERRMRFEDNPQALTYERFLAAAHIANGYHHAPIGWMNDLRQMSDQDLQTWYNKWYAPNNALIVVVGDVKPEQVYQLALQYFGPLKPGRLPVVKQHSEVPSLGERNVLVKLPAQLPWLIMGYNVPSIKSDPSTDDTYTLAVIASILSSGDSSWLEKDLVRGQQIAAGANASYDPTSRLPTLFTLDGTPSPGHTTAQLKQAFFSEIQRLQNQLVDEKELSRIKAGIIAAKVYSQDSISNQAMEIGSLEVVGLPWQLRDEFIKRVAQVTPQQVQEVARRYLINDNLTTTELQPLPLAENQQHKAPLPGPSPVGGEHVH